MRRPLIALAIAGVLLGCRGIVDDLFGDEQPVDGALSYELQIVPASASAQPAGGASTLLYFETTAPADSYLAVRVVDGYLSPLGASSDTDSVACICVGSGITHVPFLVRNRPGESAVVFGGLFEKSSAAEVDANTNTEDASTEADAASDASSAPALMCGASGAAAVPQCGGAPCENQQYVFGICPSGILKRVRARGTVVAPSGDGGVVESDSGADVDASDAGTDAGDADAAGDQ